MATYPSDAGSIPLIDQMLQRLRAGIPIPSSDDEDPLDLSPPGRLGAEHVIAAHLLGTALALHFRSLDDLAATTCFVGIVVRGPADARLISRVLKAALPDNGVTIEPQYRLDPDDKYPIFIGSGPRLEERLRLVSEAARRGLPAFWLYGADEDPPAPFAGVADFIVDASTMTRDMLNSAFIEFFSRTPANFSELGSPGKLAASDLALHFRHGRSPEACVDGLKTLMRKERTIEVARSRLEDQHGYGEARVWGLELAQDFELWRRGRLSWREVDHRSVLLGGLPGTGKTTFAGLLAGTLGVPLIESSVAEWNAHDHLSGTLKRMREVFQEAMVRAPCVLLVDELDGISSRQNISGRYMEYWSQIINLLLELVTQAMATEGLVLVGATNYLDRIDPALRRSGRLDHTIVMTLPSPSEIVLILAKYAGTAIAETDLRSIAPQLHGKTGADIEKLVRTAKAIARRAGRVFSIADLRGQASGGFEKLLPQVRRRIATYRAGQVVVAQVLGILDVASEDHAFGGQFLVRSLDDGIPTEQDYNDVIAVLMAGRAAEEILFDSVSVLGATTADSDLALATDLARQIEINSGLGETGLIYLDDSALRELVPTSIIGSIRRRLDDAMARASSILLAEERRLNEIISVTARGSTFPNHRQPRSDLH